MKKCVTLVTLFMTLVLLAFTLNAQDRFDRAAVIPAEADDIGGFGGVVAGVDFDGDGRLEIYAVNNDWYDQIGQDLKPRMYKYEQNASGGWDIVWSTELSFDFQNTWPGFEAADLDNDGRQEIVWGPVNNFGGGSNPNPSRIVVFESAGDGSDIMGVDDGAGGYMPNAEWTIVDQDNINLRPFRWHIVDIDNDNTDEIVACIRAGDVGMQIYSTNDVPDAGDGSETWELEFSGLSGTYWDINVIGNTAYAIEEGGDVTLVSWDGSAYVVGRTQAGLVPGGSWKSSSVVDINDTDMIGEVIVVGGWISSSDNQVWILQPDADSLIATQIADFPDSGGRINGGAVGDLDSDGWVDIVFGSRSSDPNGRIHRLEYQGGDILDPSNYTLSVIDQEANTGTQYDVVAIANMDGDSDDEVVYSGTPRGNADPPQPIVVLDRIPGNQPVISAVQDVPNDQGRQVWVIWEGAADDVPGMRFTANLSGDNEPNPVATTGTGKATFTLSEDKTTLSYLLEVRNITGVTQAHIHQGQPGANGTPGVFLFGFLTGGTGPFNGILSSGTITEADLINQWAGDFEGFVNDLMAGNTYVNVHTVANAGGEIRGQLLSDPLSKAERQPAKNSGFNVTHYVVWRIDGGQYPVQVARVDAIQAAAYAAVVPTLGDAPDEATYVVSAHTPTVTTLWKSIPKSGTSEDNLIPTAPTNLAASLLDGTVQLTWDESPDPDFNYFSIRRGDQSGFDPNAAEEIGTTTEAAFLDENVQAGETWYYRVVAFDFNNNLGEFSDEVSTAVTGIGDDAGALPRVFALRDNFPNPFNPETNIAFDLPKAVDVNIIIYNALGQKVRTLVDESRPAGAYTVRWDGRNDAGVKVASGLYIYTIKAGEFSATKKMTLLK